MSFKILEKLSFDLPLWTESDFLPLKRDTEKIEKLTVNAGNSSDRFNEICRLLRRLAQHGQVEAVIQAIKGNIEVRALSFLLSDEQFLKLISISKELLDSLYLPGKKLGRLTLLQLIEAYFKKFDLVGKEDVFKYFENMVRKELKRFGSSEEDSDLAKLREHRKRIFTSKGPHNVVEYAHVNKLDLDHAFIKLGLSGFLDGRFQDLCRYQYYLKTLRSLPVGENHPVLSEVCKPDVYKAPSGQGRFLGHDILEIMIDKAGSHDVSEEWQHVILAIAGDPRVPQSNPRYQQWWYQLGEKRIQKVRGWLSKFDLLLFLDILEDFGRTTADDSLKRMFPSRKSFLIGLHEQGLISEARLFISRNAERYIKKRYHQKDLPEYANLNDRDRSIIYLKVGDHHIIEGSHNSYFRIFKDIPIDADIFKFSIKNFDYSDLGTGLVSYCRSNLDYYDSDWPVQITHNPNITWQAKAIANLKKLGIRVNIEKLFSNEDYHEYKYRFGL